MIGPVSFGDTLRPFIFTNLFIYFDFNETELYVFRSMPRTVMIQMYELIYYSAGQLDVPWTWPRICELLLRYIKT